MILDYKCKFCGKPGQVDAGEYTSGIFDLTKWVKILCCDRCGAYMESKRKKEDKIKSVCLDLWSFRKATREPAKVREAEVNAEQNLIVLTKSYAKQVCDYYERETTWDAEFVNSLMDSPTMCSKIMMIYRHGIQKAPYDPQP